MTEFHEELHGIDRVRKANCLAAGWEWCDEHKRNKSGGSNACWLLHETKPQQEAPEWTL